MPLFADASATELSVGSSIESLVRLFGIILALAIGEAFKQFVSDKAEKPEDRHIHWDRIFALVSFIFLVVPFFHGMARYFFETYREAVRPRPYAGYLLFDSGVFTVESILFFVLSRSLPRVQWRRFYLTVVLLLFLDIIWGAVEAHDVARLIVWWVIINFVALVLLGLVLFFQWKTESMRGAILCMVILIGRTIADYSYSFSYYFPPQPQARAANPSGERSMASPPKIYLAGPGVFLRDSEEFGREKRRICERHGLNGHYPSDNQLPIPDLLKTKGPRGTVLELSKNDEKGMDQCDVILADLTPCFSGLTNLQVLVRGQPWDKGTLLKQCPGLQEAFDRYPGLAELMIDFPEAGQLLTGQPDAGTVFEMGYMVAKSKRAFGEAAANAFAYSNSPLDYYTRMLIANAGNLPKRTSGVAANLVEEDINGMMVDRLDRTLHCNLMLDSPVIRFSGKEVHRPTINETRQFLEAARRQGRTDGMYRHLAVFERAVQHAAEVLKSRH
jgi:nucleoside 2-deoxyribosyltransferase